MYTIRCFSVDKVRIAPCRIFNHYRCQHLLLYRFLFLICFVPNIHFTIYIQYTLTWLLIFIPLKGICFAGTSILYVHCLKKNHLCIITFSTVNIIPSALKLTPATKSMINKAQYCQRHWLCNIIPLTHSHGPVTLSLCSKSACSFEADTEGMSMVQTFLSYFYLFILYLLVPCGKCLKDKNRGLGFRRGGHDKREIT